MKNVNPSLIELAENIVNAENEFAEKLRNCYRYGNDGDLRSEQVLAGIESLCNHCGKYRDQNQGGGCDRYKQMFNFLNIKGTKTCRRIRSTLGISK